MSLRVNQLIQKIVTIVYVGGKCRMLIWGYVAVLKNAAVRHLVGHREFGWSVR
jgi:hypothetical protein